MRPASEKRQGTKSRWVGHPPGARAVWGFGRVVRARALCRFSDAGKTCSPRAHAAGVRKAPRHEIAVGGAPGGAASAMGIWAGRACPCNLMAAVRMIALG